MTCTACQGRCPTPAACHKPEPKFRPTFEVQGPYRGPEIELSQKVIYVLFVIACVLVYVLR